MEVSTNKEILAEIDSYMKSGNYKVVGLDFLERIYDIKVSSNVLELQKEFLELYRNYLENIRSLPEGIQSLFLKAIKNDEIVANHGLERINPFTISMYMLSKRKSALDKLLEIDGDLTATDFKRLHYTLLKNTPTSEETPEFRKENSIFVGYYHNGKRVIEFFPIDYKSIPMAVSEFLKYYNNQSINVEESFIKPLIVHGIVSGLQIFRDGNTRFARMLQHGILYDSTIKHIDSNLSAPALYSSKTYYPFREKYRYLIKNLIMENNDEVWNQWFTFNYHRFEDQLMVNEENIRELKKTL